jgi:putative FmdB family regulatory protein
MPIYAYKCSSCGFAKDVLQKMSDPKLTECPSCGASTFDKQLTAAGFQLKGSGWYVTDFREGGGKKGEGGEKGGEKGSEKAGETGADKAGEQGAGKPADKAGEKAAPSPAASSDAPAAKPASTPAPAPAASPSSSGSGS